MKRVGQALELFEESIRQCSAWGSYECGFQISIGNWFC